MTVDQIVERLGLWPVRAAWLVGPLAAGSAVARLLDGRPDTRALVVEIALWAVWFAVLVATLAPSPRSLTLCRIATPGAVGLAVLALIADGVGAATVGALVWAAVTVVASFGPAVADHMVNGSAYGSERRMALRPPGFVLVGPIQVAWLAVFAGLVGPAALFLGGRSLLAAMAAVVGLAAAWAGSRILHQLSRRWVVFVPAGFVLRDPMLLVDAVLFRRHEVASLGPALTDGEGRTDLTGGAGGLALEVALKEPAPIGLRERNEARHTEVTNVVFSPSLPGALLREARIRGLRIDTAAPVD